MSDDPRVVALSNKYCANANIEKLKDARITYGQIRDLYR